MVPNLVPLDLNKDESSDVKLGMVYMESCWEPSHEGGRTVISKSELTG